MKKFLFLMMMGIGLINLAVAQTVELVGVGVLNNDETTLTFDNPGSIEKVVVEAAAIFNQEAPPSPVVFTNGTTSISADYNNVDENKSPNSYNEENNSYSLPDHDLPFYLGYYTAEFTSLEDGEITLDKNEQGNGIVSFYAYIYRTDGSVNSYSLTSEKRAFLYLNGADDPLEYLFDLEPATGLRDMEIKIPFSDADDIDNRIGVVSLLIEDIVVESNVFQLNQLSTNFHFEILNLYDVPVEVTEIKLEIYSPADGVTIEGKKGDSFIVGMPLLTVEEEEQEEGGCTYTQGYWKTHSEYGPAPYDDNWLNLSNIGADTEFYLSEMTWYEVFWTPVKGNAYYNLAHQYMAAHLNMLMGTSVPTEVADALADAEGIFAAKEPGYYAKTKGKSEASKQEIAWLTSLASILASYNEGDIGPGHCDDMEEWGMEKSAQIGTSGNNIAQINELAVYPNPVTGYATVSFMPVYDGKTTVDLYNSTGKTVKRLFSESVTKDIPVNFTFTASEFSEGLYFLVVQNGQGRETTKIDIK